MVGLLLSPEPDLGRSYVVKTIYDPACGTGGMLSIAEEYLREHNRESRPILYGQDWNDEAWAVCKSDMLIKGENSENIILADTFIEDGYDRQEDGSKHTFDYMLANPPFGVEWKQQKRHIEREHSTLGYDGRFGAGLPRINDGSLLFLQHMLSKMQPVEDGGSRIAIVFNGSPLFTGDAGSGESNIRQWIIENDWLEAIVALPDQLFYNTGISTYVWVLTNRKEPHRQGKIQLIDGRQFFVKMRRSLNNKRNELSPEQIEDLVCLHGNFLNDETRDLTDEDPVTHQPRTRPRVVSKVFSNDDFGYRKVTVERPLRLNFAATAERTARIEEQKTFQNMATSRKSPGPAHDAEVAEGLARQERIRDLLNLLSERLEGQVILDRDCFTNLIKETAKEAELRILAPDIKVIIAALGVPDADAEICRDRRGNSEPDSDLRDTEIIPLTEDVDDFIVREVLPHAPDAWVDESKTKIGYEIPLNRHFYVYESPRPLESIESDIRELEREIFRLLSEVTA